MNYFGLLMECPKQNKHDECPFRSYRSLSFREAVQLWEMISFQSRNEFINKHLSCTLLPHYTSPEVPVK